MKKFMENLWLWIKLIAGIIIFIIIFPYLLKAKDGVENFLTKIGLKVYKKNFTDNEDGTITSEDGVDVVIPVGVKPEDVKEVFMPTKIEYAKIKEKGKDEKEYSVDSDGTIDGSISAYDFLYTRDK